MFHLMFVRNTFSAIWFAEWPSLRNLLPARLAKCSYCLLSSFYFYFLYFIYFSFLRVGQVWCLFRQIRVFGVYLLYFLSNKTSTSSVISK